MKLKLPVHRFTRQYDPNEYEMMDRPDADRVLLEGALRNIERLNRWLGAYHLIHLELEMMFSEWGQDRSDSNKICRILDCCTGSGDIPRAVVDWCRKRKIPIQVVATDMNPWILEKAQKEAVGYPEITFKTADVLHLPFADRSYDWVFCGLALHHFSTEQAVAILKEMWRLARIGILIHDLNRGRMLSLLTKVCIPFLSANPMTRFDAYTSTRRAFTQDEMLRLVFHARIPSPQVRRYFFRRQVLVAQKSNAANP